MHRIVEEQVMTMEKSWLLSCGDLQIPCRESAPEDGDIRRVVLGVHGFGGSANDEIQAGIAQEMALFYSATLRFDFPAHGESPLDSHYFTLSNCLDSLLAVARYAKQAYPQAKDLCIFATGFGAYVTLIALEELLALPGELRLVVQTPSVHMDETLLSMVHMTEPTLRALEKTTIRASRPFDVTYSLYEELRDNVAMTAYPIPMLILHGEDDDYIRMEDIQYFHSLNEGSKLVIIPGTSHRFLEDGAWDMVLDLTRDWFEFQQVLLSDWD